MEWLFKSKDSIVPNYFNLTSCDIQDWIIPYGSAIGLIERYNPLKLFSLGDIKGILFSTNGSIMVNKIVNEKTIYYYIKMSNSLRNSCKVYVLFSIPELIKCVYSYGKYNEFHSLMIIMIKNLMPVLLIMAFILVLALYF